MNSDLRYAWRSIWKSPATTMGAILALALGVGATSTIFALFNAVLLRPLPYPDADRLVEIWGTVQREQAERRGTSFPDYYDWRDRTRSFDAMTAWLGNTFIVYGNAEPTQVNGEVVDGPYFEVLGGSPIEGRVLQPSDHRADATPVAVIGERLWEQQFNRRSDAIGKSIRLNARAFTIVGVVPADFRGRSDVAEVWTPAATTFPRDAMNARGSRSFAPIARLAPRVTLEAAQADIASVCAQLEKEYFATNEKRSAQVSPLASEIFATVRPAVSLLFGVVALVLLIACANVASLLLARSESRKREMSLRRALGAENSQLLRLMLAESALLVLFGAGVGWVLSQWTMDAVLALSPVQLPSFAAPATDWRTVAFASLVAVLTTVLIGLTPLASFGRDSLAQSLREDAVAARGGERASVLRFIVVGEVALAVALLVGAALLGRSFSALLNFDPGFDPRGVLSLRVQLPIPPAPPVGTPATPVQPAPLALPLLEQLRAVPGVRQASLTTSVPLADAGAIFYSAEGMPPTDATNRPRTFVHRVTPGYFETLGLDFVEGRDFQPSEMGARSTAIIVSEGVVRRFWPGQSAIGRRVKQGALDAETPWLTIIGVVKEANLRGIPRNPTADPDFYLPFNEQARSFAVLLRSQSSDPSNLTGPVRDVLRRTDPGIAMLRVRSLEALIDVQLAPARFLSWLTGAFASIAMTLALIGIYGMLSYWVRRRTAEIGIRSALGANRARLLRLVVGQAMVMTVIGVTLGALLAAGLTRFVETQLFGVQAMDWVSFAGTAAVMMMAAFLASVAPAMRAMRLDPIAALRSSTR